MSTFQHEIFTEGKSSENSFCEAQGFLMDLNFHGWNMEGLGEIRFDKVKDKW